MLVALVLLLTKLKAVIERAGPETVRYGVREAFFPFDIGIWLGFIVLDGATFMLLTLCPVVGIGLTPANGIKSPVLMSTTAVAMIVFSFRGSIDWSVGAILGVGSMIGPHLGVRLSTSKNAKKDVFRLLVVVISAELVPLVWHYVFKTQG